jgi:hypothetical protein
MTEDAIGEIVSETARVGKSDGGSQSKKPRKKRKNSARNLKRHKREARAYPGRPLEDCIKVVEAIKTQNAGNPWPPDEIAKL